MSKKDREILLSRSVDPKHYLHNISSTFIDAQSRCIRMETCCLFHHHLHHHDLCVHMILYAFLFLFVFLVVFLVVFLTCVLSFNCSSHPAVSCCCPPPLPLPL